MKIELRKKAKEIRKSIDTKTLSLKIYEKIISLDEYKNAKNICIYYSIRDEVITEYYFKDKNKNWFLPKIKDNELIICPYNATNLILNAYNIPEPDTQKINNSIIDLIIIPALAADRNGYRIGYGKGYYDRLLKKLNPHTIKLTAVFSELFINDVYPDSYDEKSDIIVTDNNIYRINC